MTIDKSQIIDNYSAKTTAQAFWNLFPALVIASIIPALSGLVNGLIVGNSYPPEAMAAVSFAAPVSMLISSVAIIFSSGAGISYGRYLGKGQAEDVHKVYSADIMILFIVGIVLTVIGELFANPIAMLIGAKGETLPTTTTYLRGLFIGILPSLIMPSLVTFLNLGNEAKYGMLSSLVLALFNLIFGLLNVNVIKGGMFGIGLAASLSQYLSAAFLYIKFIKHPELGHWVFNPKKYAEIKNIIVFGLPAAIIQIGSALRNMYINSMTLATGGTLAVAGFGILGSTCEFFFSVDSALVAATTTLISISVGEEDRTSLYNHVRYLLKIGAVIFISVGIVYFITAPYIAILFGARDEGVTMAATCIRLCSTEFLTSWFCRVILGTYQSLGRLKLSSVLQFMISCIYAVIAIIAAVAILPSDKQVIGVWSSFGIAQLMGAVTIIIISWIRSGHFPLRVDYLLWLDKDFGVEDEDRLVISIDSMDDVINVAHTVQTFLKERNIDDNRRKKTALCLEEMAGNIVDHGFSKNSKKKDLTIDIYVAVKNGDIKIRIRDNAPQFNPFKKLEQYKKNENDPMKNIGIRMVSKIAKKMEYHTTLGMNTLSIDL